MTVLSSLTTRRLLFPCTLALGVLAPAAHAVAQRPIVKATIPFSFQDGSHTFPAGQYIIQETSENMILIRSASGNQVGLAMALEQSREVAPETGKLIFYKYGDLYFLRDIWLANNKTGRQVVMSRAEKKLRGTPAKRPAPGTQIALNATQP